ncbi:MAG: DUF2339 domain-containing protein [Saprospiraceae bacterium]
MEQDPDKFDELTERLNLLLRKQDRLQVEAHRLRQEIELLKKQQRQEPTPKEKEGITASVPVSAPSGPSVSQERMPLPKSTPSLWSRWTSSRQNIEWEKFIGENLVSKIGILITVIGVAFGAKYAIDNELISPLTRIVLGYLAGIGLLGLAIRLKEKYRNFSAVLLSGALAIMYIITYFAYNYYALFPQAIAFALMVLLTAFSVLAAWHYNQQIIALMGLVGAYGVPFLLSEDSGNVQFLFIYMAVINAGILAIAFRKSWKLLFHAAFWLTWLIFSWWAADGYRQDEHFGLGLTFLSVFYLLFYATFLAYKIPAREPFSRMDVVLLLTNSFIFFGFGYKLLDGHPGAEQYLGIFAVVNALIHFLVGKMIQRAALAEKSLFYFVIGLVLVFLTLAVPIQLDGNWVTLLWVGEAALLFWLGRTRQVAAFERMVLPLIVLAFISLLQDWSNAYDVSLYTPVEDRPTPILNIQFLSSILFAAAVGFMVWLQQGKQLASPLPERNFWRNSLRYVLPAVLILVLFYGFQVELQYYWRLQEIQQPGYAEYPITDYTFRRLGNIWGVYYAIIFLGLLSWINMTRIKNRLLGWINLGLNVIAVLSFLVIALYELGKLHVSYAIDDQTVLASADHSHTYLRYVGYILLAGLLYITNRYRRAPFVNITSNWPFDALLHLTALSCSSSELVYWLSIYNADSGYKLGLSILWGVYSLLLISLGIAQRKAYLRVAAIVLFAITLIKLFFYDIAHLNTISKTIVLLALGGLLLLISFLYNKFTTVIGDEAPSVFDISSDGEDKSEHGKDEN